MGKQNDEGSRLKPSDLEKTEEAREHWKKFNLHAVGIYSKSIDV